MQMMQMKLVEIGWKWLKVVESGWNWLELVKIGATCISDAVFFNDILGTFWAQEHDDPAEPDDSEDPDDSGTTLQNIRYQV